MMGFLLLGMSRVFSALATNLLGKILVDKN